MDYSFILKREKNKVKLIKLKQMSHRLIINSTIIFSDQLLQQMITTKI